MSQNHIVSGSYKVIGKGPNAGWNQYIHPELYFLTTHFGWTVQFETFGNKVIYDNQHRFRRHVLLVCKDFTRYTLADVECRNGFLGDFVGYQLKSSVRFPNSTVLYMFENPQISTATEMQYEKIPPSLTFKPYSASLFIPPPVPVF